MEKKEVIEFTCVKCGAEYFVIGDIPEFTCNCGGRVFRRKKE